MMSRVLKQARIGIRRLEAADVSIWRELRLEALKLHPEAYGSTHDEWAGRPDADFAARLKAGYVFGAFSGRELIGSMALDVDARHPSYAEITSVFVLPAHRGHGVGRRLLGRALKIATSQRVNNVSLSVAQENAAAIALYRRAGFTITGLQERALIRDGRMIELIGMSKRI